MKKTLFQTLFLCLPILIFAQTTKNSSEKRIASTIDSSHIDNVVLKQSFIVNSSLDAVWDAYTTKKAGKVGQLRLQKLILK